MKTIHDLVKMKVHHFFLSPYKPKFFKLAQEESAKQDRGNDTCNYESKPEDFLTSRCDVH